MARPAKPPAYRTSAQTLATEIQGGSYEPTKFSECDPELTADRGIQSIALTEFTLLEERRRKDSPPRFAAIQPQHLDSSDPAARASRYRESKIDPFIEDWQTSLSLAELAPDGRSGVDKIRSSLRQLAQESTSDKGAVARLAGRLPDSSLPDERLKEQHGAWRRRLIDQLVREQLSRLSAATGAESGRPPPDRLLGLGDLSDAFVDLAYPAEYQYYGGPHALVALCTVYEQVWAPKGYTRGELIGSLSLAPGERLTLEVHSWDKTSSRSEAELAVEFEMRTSEKHTQRDALTVLQEYATKENTKVEARGTIPIPKFPLELGAQTETESQSRLNETTERIREDVVEAASVLKVNRKLRVESSRETGREEKQTRIVENTNRCHTLNCHYFEIMANYLVETRPVEVQPCLLLRNARRKFTRRRIVCNEGILRRSLLDRTFLSGFEAARELGVIRREAAVETRRRLERLDVLGQQLQPYAQIIADSYEVLASAASAMEDAIAEEGLGNQLRVASNLTVAQIDHIWAYYALPNEAHTALRRLVTQLGAGDNAGEALRALLTILEPGIPPRPYYETFLDINNELGSNQVSGEGEIKNIYWEVTSKDLLDCDDAGLRAAVAAATSALRSVPMPEFSEVTQTPAREVALAETDFERLRCHLEKNWMHYNQAIWAQESYDQRFERLRRYGPISTLVENRLLGFLGEYAAYPLLRLDAAPVVDFERIVGGMRKAIKDFVAEPVLIAMPTDGQVLEATVGKCDACESYIEESRTIDLRLQSANARQAEAEAQRLKRRVDAGDLADPSPDSPRLGIDLQTTTEPS